jgi:hypothetical protein
MTKRNTYGNNILGTKKDEIKVSVTERDGSLYSKSTGNIKRGDVVFSLPLGVCLDVNKAVTKFGPLTSKLRTGDVNLYFPLTILSNSIVATFSLRLLRLMFMN